MLDSYSVHPPYLGWTGVATVDQPHREIDHDLAGSVQWAPLEQVRERARERMVAASRGANSDTSAGPERETNPSRSAAV